MLERLETSFVVQKNFIANASHEMRTPLTSINGQLEVLMMKDRSSAEYRAAVSSVLDDIKSLTDLLNRLLLIARTSSEKIDNYKRDIRLDENTLAGPAMNSLIFKRLITTSPFQSTTR